ncbi:MAG: cyclopropane-fatty-acyl-phospholipid synthase family protein [Actinomycetota bacterium]|nr:cyclopropane-fatty-acyl-phospholipid synthase family protein [Actinomycetota bacterium]
MTRRIALRLLARLGHGQVVIFEQDGQRHDLGPADAALRVEIEVRDKRFWAAIRRGGLGAAEAYGEGWFECDDLVALVRIFALELRDLDRLRRALIPLQRIGRLVPRNTRGAARKHIAAHYDLGDQLFELFLDETMSYSSAVFEPAGISLAEAQREKIDRICRKLELGPADHLVEIGSGWGSLAVHAAERYGCRVTTTTISRAQHAATAARVREQGLEGRVQVLMEDYRDLEGTYSKLVSVEMMEAVGWQYFGAFFEKCSALLEPDGRMCLQTIVIDDRAYEPDKAAKSFANTVIFPGGCLPSHAVIARSIARRTDMRVLDLEDLSPHYAETVRRWREGFAANAERAEALGYDLRFRRMWDLYLAWCEGGFVERRIGVAQILTAKPAYRDQPSDDGRFARLKPLAVRASSTKAGPREASLARAVRPPGPTM